MIVCSCNVFTDRAVLDCMVLQEKPTVSRIFRSLDCEPKCGRCASTIRDMIRAAGGTAIDALEPQATEAV